MLTARPASWFSWDYRLFAGDREVAAFDLSLIAENAEVEIGGVPFRFDREGMTGDFTLSFEGTVIARATKQSVLSNTFHVRLEDGAATELTMRRPSVFTNSFAIAEGAPEAAGPVLGTIRRTSLWTRKAVVDLPERVPLGVQVFLFWLAVLMWRRSSRSS